jgi:DNA-binding MarR family transcriptional regulator
MLERLFRSKAEVSVLGVVLFSESLHLREIARRAGISSSEAKKELDNLVDLGLLFTERKGNLVLFYTDRRCAFLDDLRNVFIKVGKKRRLLPP